MADKNLNPMNQKVYDVSNNPSDRNYNQQAIAKEESQSLFPYSAMLENISKRYGMSEDELEDVMSRVAFHETGPGQRLHPDAIQRVQGGEEGVGRGLFQFETGRDQGGATAMKRLRGYLRDAIPVGKLPEWTEFDPITGVDASQLTPEQQKMMFMANVRYHPAASLAGVTPENVGEKYWAPFHWAGQVEEKAARLRAFEESMAAYDLLNKKTVEEEAFGY